MEFIKFIVDLLLHTKDTLTLLINEYNTYIYAILFLIIFCETGLVVMPFLPGDSLLFVIGTFCALGSLNIYLMCALLMIAVVLGDTTNYFIGKFFGQGLFKNENSKIFKKEHLDKTHAFYEKHGKKTIIIARFIPIIRTFAPFVAGMGGMPYLRFISYSIVGGVTWIISFTLLGFFFGNLPVVQERFTLVIFAIIFISILPGIIAFIKGRMSSKSDKI